MNKPTPKNKYIHTICGRIEVTHWPTTRRRLCRALLFMPRPAQCVCTICISLCRHFRTSDIYTLTEHIIKAMPQKWDALIPSNAMCKTLPHFAATCGVFFGIHSKRPIRYVTNICLYINVRAATTKVFTWNARCGIALNNWVWIFRLFSHTFWINYIYTYIQYTIIWFQ